MHLRSHLSIKPQLLLFSLAIICVLQFSCKNNPIIYPEALPSPDHIVIVFMENHSYHEIIDSTEAPFIQSLAFGKHCALFSNSNALGHPSQPNYFELFSGSNQGIITNDRPLTQFNTPNLGYALINAGYSFATYSEGLPYAGFDGDTSENGAYVRKHNPASNWVGTEINQIDASVNQPLTALPPDFNDLPTVSYIIPDLYNSMHSAAIKIGDDWIEIHFKEYISWAKSHNSLFILTFDESSYASGTELITTLIVGRTVKEGIYDNYINHEYLLRTLEDMYSLPHSGNAENVPAISNCWKQVN